MVNLMLQPVFLNLVKGSIDHKMTSDDLYNMWSVATKAKSAIVQGQRLENLSWRLWYTSTIRSKLEMEEKQSKRTMNGSDLEEFDDVATETEVESSPSSSSPHSKWISEGKRKQMKSSVVFSTDKPLFTSICTSILAEIQDASIRFGQSSGHSNKISQNSFSSGPLNHNSPNNYPIHHHTHSSHPQHSVSPPSSRAKSPGVHQQYHTTANSRKKKNVEKFLKKYKTKLEDITEQFDDKLGFTDDDDHEAGNNSIVIPNEHQASTEQILNISVSPTSHFATDEDAGQTDDSFTFSSTNLKIIEHQCNPDNNPKSKQYQSQQKHTNSMISKLLKSESGNGSSPRSIKSTTSPEPIQNTRQFSPSNSSLVKDHLESLASNRYDRFNIPSLKSPVPSLGNPPGNTAYHNNSRHERKDSKKSLIMDVNSLSTSLSASKFTLEDEFDTQTIICCMAKKSIERKLTNPEAYERINFLLHISTSSLLLEYKRLLSEKYPKLEYFTPALIKKELQNTVNLVQSYVKTIREVSKKSVIRLSPNTKRSLCKKCNCLLLPSITSKIRYTRRKGRDWTAIRCVQCGNVERYLIPFKNCFVKPTPSQIES